ncbi:MAG: hypothetical protein IJC07_02200 [Clostridia bacterium]|nr:hypothetical protein [Clostridia bacterium]
MKKLLTTVVALVLALSMIIMAGCKLVSIDQEKNAKQVVATVQIDKSAPKDEILKKDILIAYLNYGYQQEYNGATREKVINDIIDNLVYSRVYVQSAMLRFSENKGIYAGNVVSPELMLKDKFDVNAYLTDDEIYEATYNAKKIINDNIESFMETEDEKKGDTVIAEDRTVPTGATNVEEPVRTPEEEKEYKKNYQIIVDDEDGSNRRYDAVSKFINLLDANNLLGAYKNDLTQTDYYIQSLQAQKEQIVINKYVDCIYNDINSKYGLSDIETLFNEKVEKQGERTDAEYSTALESATALNPVLNAPTGTYGYVYNLLIGASDQLKEKLNEWKEKYPNATEEALAAARADIFAGKTPYGVDEEGKYDDTIDSEIVVEEGIMVKDLRSSWITNGYDFDGEKFTGDYTFVEGDALKFDGDVTLLNGEDAGEEDYKAEYRVDKVNELTFDEFIKLFEEYLYGGVQTGNVEESSIVYKGFKTTTAKDNYDERVNELLFAYSTDPGSLNSYKGYAISPIPDGSNTEKWQQEFADYGRQLLKMGDKSYVIVATDYGYHVMFYSEGYEGGAIYGGLTDYLNKECAFLLEGGKTWEDVVSDMQKNWREIADGNTSADYEVASTYLYTLYNELVYAELSESYTKDYVGLINKYVYLEDGSVEIFEDRYQDLIDVE